MKKFKSWGMSLIAALLLVACGGGDPTVPGSGSPSGAPTTKGTFTAVVSFGDSLSDVGTYTPATVIPGTNPPVYIGGKFTTNSATGTIWVENLATSLGLMITPAEMGWGSQTVPCPIAVTYPSLASTCTGYGQGGSRVTNPNGVDYSPTGALTVPVVTQIANHLASHNGSFKSSDLILVYAGSNDVFTQFGTFAATAAQVQAAAAAGTMTADQANTALFNAQTLAMAGMKQAAQELGGYVRTQILANGGQYVAVFLLSDISQTPFGQSLPASAQPVLTQLSQNFNLWLRDSLTNQPVQLIDTFALFNAIAANLAQYGIANNTTPACDPAKISAITGGAVTTGSSLFCNSTAGAPYNGLLTGANVTTWFFADTVHPTTGGHKILSDAITAQLKLFGWI
jgi:phospholipase/lecithinase/hemolysin